MANYLVDFELSLFHTEHIEASSVEEARAKAEELLDDDGFWGQLLACYDDPLQTDWLPENVQVSVQGEVGE